MLEIASCSEDKVETAQGRTLLEKIECDRSSGDEWDERAGSVHKLSSSRE